MCSFGDGGGPEFFEALGRKARKSHECDGCRRTIAPGERYVFVRFLSRGTWDAQKCCLQCDADIDVFGEAHDAFPFPSALREVLAECVSDGDPESDAKWRPMLDALDARKAAAA